jgi:hypothetical protein
VRRPELPSVPGILDAAAVLASARSIADAQEPSGAIPWFAGGHVDPWDHVECAMALSACGLRDEAVAAYDYLRATQRDDGSWPARITVGRVEDAGFETNQCAYVAVGVWHHVQVTGDVGFGRRMWPTVRRALDLVISLATVHGAIGWAGSPGGSRCEDALLTGSSSTYHSLRCGLALADLVGDAQPGWEIVAGRLGHVVAAHPEAFLDKDRFAMDWYYPVLAGAVSGEAGRDRLSSRWEEFVVPGIGSRCVSDQPWVTGAETAELVLALDCVGWQERALALLSDIQRLREPDGSYWTGWQFAERGFWPDEHSTWTAAAVILAADALSRTSPGNGIFRGEGLPTGLDTSTCQGEVGVRGAGAAGCRPGGSR